MNEANSAAENASKTANGNPFHTEKLSAIMMTLFVLPIIMAAEILTDEQIKSLIDMPKRVENPGAKTRTEGKHIRRDFRVKSLDEKYEFALFTRQSTLLPDSFSTGLRWLSQSGETIMLVRFNGSSHPHSNTLEDERFEFKPHIHQATERYLTAGKKDEGYAEATKDFKTIHGALHCLVKKCNIAGLTTQGDEPDLFDYHEN